MPSAAARSMDAKVSVGRLSDVDVAIDWTWIAAAFASFAALAAASPWVLSTLSTMELAIFAAVAAASLFACLALHELVRVAVLRASGVAVRGVAVFVLGGISDAETRPPRADAAAALVAQSASAVTGAAALGVAAVLVAGAAPSAAAVALAGWLVASGAADGYAIVAAQGEGAR